MAKRHKGIYPVLAGVYPKHDDPEELKRTYSGSPFFLGKEFTSEDRGIMGSVISMVPMLAVLLGKYCEIIVHSLEDPAHAVVAVANADISRRKIGDSVTRVGLETILSKVNYNNVYFCHGQRGEQLKVGVIPIINGKGRILGSLSLGWNLDAPFSDFIENFSASANNESEEIRIWGYGAINIEDIIDEVCNNINAKKALPVKLKAKLIITELYHKGIFNYRNAAKLVSEKTGISVMTVYWHLREIKNASTSKQK